MFTGLSLGQCRLAKVGCLVGVARLRVCVRSFEIGCEIFLCGLILGVKTEKEPLVGE